LYAAAALEEQIILWQQQLGAPAALDRQITTASYSSGL